MSPFSPALIIQFSSRSLISPAVYHLRLRGASSIHALKGHRVMTTSTGTAAVEQPGQEQQQRRHVRKFAPLDPAKAADSKLPKLAGIVFDVDGTLCEPQNYMFAQMREALGIQKPTDILAHIESLPSKEEQEEGMNKIKAIELSAMKDQKPRDGLVELMDYLESRGIQRAILTRNFDLPVTHLLEKFLAKHHQRKDFDPILTRSFKPPKPDPAGMLHIASTWNLPNAEGLIMVGDSEDDMLAGYRAGAGTVLCAWEGNQKEFGEMKETGRWVLALSDLIPLLEEGYQQGDEE